jgi:hypothetical protein
MVFIPLAAEQRRICRSFSEGRDSPETLAKSCGAQETSSFRITKPLQKSRRDSGTFAGLGARTGPLETNRLSK